MMRRVAAVQMCFALVQAFCLAPFQHIHSGHDDDHDHAGLVHARFYHVVHLSAKSGGWQMDDDDEHASAKSLDTFTLAFVPALGAEVQRPLASVVIGALFSSTLLTLFLVPLFYDWIFGNLRDRQTRGTGY
jgi:hypothetical protein